ncbi:MAG: hypothetical protein J6U23_08825 [Clostridiales bacterium]|nr:hypothetical protein [Clostridiales bacterium]
MENFTYLHIREVQEYPFFSTGRGVILEQYIDNYISKLAELMDQALSCNTGEYKVLQALRDNMITVKEQISSMDAEMDLLLLKIENDIIDKEDKMSFEGI